MSSDFHHVPVLLDESSDHLHLKPGSVILDGTLGGGGHAEAILDRIAPNGLLVGLDLDEQALAASATRLARFGDCVRFVQSSFRHLDDALRNLGIESVPGQFKAPGALTIAQVTSLGFDDCEIAGPSGESEESKEEEQLKNSDAKSRGSKGLRPHGRPTSSDL